MDVSNADKRKSTIRKEYTAYVPRIVVMLMSMVKENFQILDFLKKHLV